MLLAEAGGGGAEHGSAYEHAGAGGGLVGQDAYANSYPGSNYGKGGTQSAAGGPAYGGFGYGGQSTTPQCGSGGGGWYGGGGQTTAPDAGGGGGSGYVVSTSSYKPSGYTVTSAYYMLNTQLIDGITSMPNTGGSTETGHSGDGYARITLI